jgi:hypothetical protein
LNVRELCQLQAVISSLEERAGIIINSLTTLHGDAS